MGSRVSKWPTTDGGRHKLSVICPLAAGPQTTVLSGATAMSALILIYTLSNRNGDESSKAATHPQFVEKLSQAGGEPKVSFN